MANEFAACLFGTDLVVLLGLDAWLRRGTSRLISVVQHGSRSVT